jgi:hypothetical protein
MSHRHTLTAPHCSSRSLLRPGTLLTYVPEIGPSSSSLIACSPLASSGRNSTRAVRVMCWWPRTAETIVHRVRFRMSKVSANNHIFHQYRCVNIDAQTGARTWHTFLRGRRVHPPTHTQHTMQRNTHTHNTQHTRTRTQSLHSWPQTPPHAQTDLHTSC